MSFSKQLKLLLHPYVFVLKEGKRFTSDCMSYDLLLLQVNNEVIKSPTTITIDKEALQKELDLLKSALPKALDNLKKNIEA